MEKDITMLNRESLYQLVWSRPTRTLAKELGISDVALGKICRKFDIPKPPPGYWRRRETGHEVKTPALPPWRRSGSATIVVRRTVRASLALPPAVQALIEAEKAQTRPIIVDPNSRRRHAALATRKKQFDKFGRPYLLSPSGVPGLSVTRHSRQRALGILKAFLFGAEERGFKIEIQGEFSNELAVVVHGTPVNCRLVEAAAKEGVTPPKEAGTHQRGQSVPTSKGRLAFETQGYLPEGTRRRWSDKDGSLLEHNLNVVMAGVIAAAEYKRAWKLDLEERTRRFEAEERRRRIEAARRRALADTAEVWSKSRDLKAFLDAADTHIDTRDQSTEVWIAWSRSYARRIDPLQNGQLEEMIRREFDPKSNEEG